MLKHILVPLDGSTVAEKALEYARRVTEMGGKITLLSVIDLPEYSFESFYPTGVLIENNQQMITEKLVPQAQGYLDLIAEPLGEAGWDVKAEVIVGEPAQAIVDRSNVLDVDAIVMSTHGRSGLSRWLFGSVTNKVLSVTDRPVFVVPIRKGEVSDA